jgi:hypothetical protein
MKIDATCSLRSFRRFIILSTCQSFIPPELLEDDAVFPERCSEDGAIYVEAEDKETVEKIRNINFVRVFDVLGVIYNSKSGRTRLKWRCTRGEMGRLTGEASGNSLVNLYASGALSRDYAWRIMKASDKY